MTDTQKTPWKRIGIEASAIVASILLAFAIDAWWESRNAAMQREVFLSGLGRDFDQMLERVEESHAWSSRGAKWGRQLSILLQNGSRIDPELARESLFHLASFEVFSPSVGAYQALLSTGNLYIFENDELQLELRDFFGSFEDVRVTERLLLNSIQKFVESPTFGQLAGWQRMGRGDIPVAGDFPVDLWAGSEEFMNAVGLLTIRHNDVLEDYDYLRTRIRNISAGIARELSD